MKKSIVLFLPGIFSLAANVFDNTARYLKQNKIQTAFIEFPHKGKTLRNLPDWKITKVTMQTVLDNCSTIFEEYAKKYSAIYLVAHSSGAPIALHLANQEKTQEKIKGIVMINPAVAKGMADIPVSLKTLINFWPGILAECVYRLSGISLPIYRTFGSASRLVLPTDMDRNKRKKIWRQMRWESLKFIQALGNREGQEPPLVDFRNIACPIKIIHGNKDELIPASIIKEYLKKIPTAKTVEINAAHYPFWGKSGRIINSLINEFIETSPPLAV